MNDPRTKDELVTQNSDLMNRNNELVRAVADLRTLLDQDGRSTAVADARALLSKYDDLDKENRQGQGYTMLIEVQARALVAIAEALS